MTNSPQAPVRRQLSLEHNRIDLKHRLHRRGWEVGGRGIFHVDGRVFAGREFNHSTEPAHQRRDLDDRNGSGCERG